MRSEKNIIKRAWTRTVSACKRFFRWIKRGVFGAKGELSALSAQAETEQIESPSRLLRQAFFRKKSAVVALVFLAVLFLFVFIAPLFLPMDVNYTDPLQQNIAPSYTLCSPPRALKKQVQYVDGFSDFTVGVGLDGRLFVWGNTKNRLTKIDVKKIPKQVQDEGVIAASAGKDHVAVVTKTGAIVCWGDNSCGQFGAERVLGSLPMHEDLLGGVRADEVSSIVCGYQATALVLGDGRAYAWGNTNAVRNLEQFHALTGVQKVVFVNAAAVALKTDGNIFVGTEPLFYGAVTLKNGKQDDFTRYMHGRKGVDVATDGKCIAAITSDGDLVVSGAFENGEDVLPVLAAGEYFTSIDGGTRHFVGVTNFGNVYAWGHNAYDQCEISAAHDEGARVFAGSLQTYVVGADGRLLEKTGLKGYLFGTDGKGRDVFARIVHGGKTTLTIGGVAVLISLGIGVLVGCVSGYFGGAVDLILMRVTEIFSSIPFLPFAMLLSQIIKNYSVTENMRMLIIMLILGALSWTGLARMVRGQVLAEREKEFVTAARALGVRESKIAFRHVLPNIVSVILVSVTLDFAGCLLTESSLSYLGFGVQQPRPTWGNMLTGSNSSIVIQNYWWQWLFPALFLSLAVICINVIGDALRDALDPKNSV
ncbi:MAG: ABC transporter permease subunit [Clostridia bacterium]|nr:ABC transporter permease subunit [Clostridia bacterium]